MKFFIKILALVLMLVSITAIQIEAQVSSSGTKGEQEVIAFEHDFETASVRKDRNKLEQLMADGFTMIHSDGFVESKAEWIAKAAKGEHTFQRANRQTVETQLQFFGENNAVRTRYSLLQLKSENQDIWLRARYLYLKQNGQWKMISSQSTLMSLGPAANPDLYDSYVGVYEISPERKLTITKEGIRLIEAITG